VGFPGSSGGDAKLTYRIEFKSSFMARRTKQTSPWIGRT